MATVNNWIDHLSAAEVKGAVYPGVGTEGILVLILVVLWIGWHSFRICKRKANRMRLLERDLVQMTGKVMLPMGN